MAAWWRTMTEGNEGAAKALFAADLYRLTSECGHLALHCLTRVPWPRLSPRQIGLPRQSLPPSQYKSRLAFIFAAKAVVQTANPHVAPDVLQVSVVPRGSAVGRVDSRPTEREAAEELRVWSDFMTLLSIGLVGRAAEEEAFGLDEASLLTAKDVQEVTRMASEAVGQSGLYVNPTLGISFETMTFLESELDRWPAVRSRFDLAVRDTMNEAARRARRLVRLHRAAIDALAAELLEKDTVYGSKARLLGKAPGTAMGALV